MLDAIHWVPQSRPRVFIVSVPKAFKHELFAAAAPIWIHTERVVKAAEGLDHWVWWSLPPPPARRTQLCDLLDRDAPTDDEPSAKHNLGMISQRHQARLAQELANGFYAAPGYKRTRNGRQVLELRFDGVAGCLRTPEGGSSRQLLVIKKQEQLTTRLLTVREAARLMGVRASYKIPGSYNDGYRAMGDAVAVPVARFLAKHLLRPLAEALAPQPDSPLRFNGL